MLSFSLLIGSNYERRQCSNEKHSDGYFTTSTANTGLPKFFMELWMEKAGVSIRFKTLVSLDFAS